MQARLINRDILIQCIVCEFEASDPAFIFQAGEYVQIVLEDGLKHYFSVMSSPNELPVLKIATRPSQSEFKKTLLQMPIASEVEINGPWGDLFLPEDGKERTYYFVAGGIGITPFMSMIKYKVEENLPYDITLLYFADPDPIFRMDLENYANRSPHVRILFIHEKISAESIKSKILDDARNATFMVAGPPGFVNMAVHTLVDLKIPQKNIILESYTGYTN